MRTNEFNSLEDFTAQYTGEWAPSEGHWLGLDFSFRNIEYRLQTGSMFESNTDDLSAPLFFLYRKFKSKGHSSADVIPDYQLIGSYFDMEELLNCTDIQDIPFKEIIMDDSTELLGQD